MGEWDDEQQASLFDALLSDADKWHMPPRAQARRAAEVDDTVAADLALVVSLRETQPSRHELESARARIGQRLAEVMYAEPAPATRLQQARTWLRAVTSPPVASARTVAARAAAFHVQGERREWLFGALRRMSLTMVALLTLFFGLVAGASVASAHALPESPLYVIKRAEEATLLVLSWTDDSKGQTLTMIANHRLVEAAAEADQRRTSEARSLLGEFDGALSQLIDLTAHAQSTHEDASVLARAIQTTLETEQSIASHAAAHGEASFAQATSASVLAAQAHVAHAGVTLPKDAHQNNGHGGGQGNDQGKPAQTPGPKATHTPNSGSQGSQPTPTATPSSSAPQQKPGSGAGAGG